MEMLWNATCCYTHHIDDIDVNCILWTVCFGTEKEDHDRFRKSQNSMGLHGTPWQSIQPDRSISVCHTRLQNLTSFDTQLETQDTLSNRVDAKGPHSGTRLRMTQGWLRYTGFKMTFPAWLKFLRYTRSQDILAKVLYHHGGVYIDFDMHLVCTSTSVAASCKSSTLSSRCRWHFEN